MTRDYMLAKLLTATALLLAAQACSDDPTRPGTERGSTAGVLGRGQVAVDVPALQINLPAEPRPWDVDDAALVQALGAQEGNAIIAFKAPTSARMFDAGGLRAAVPAAAVDQGLEFLRTSGAEIVYVYRSFGAAWARIDPALGPELRRDARVDYIEPRQWGQVDGTPMGAGAVRTMPAAMLVQTTQTTPWGIQLVRAPAAWPLSTGAGTKIEIIDVGVIPHEDLPAIPPANCGGQFGGCDGPLFHGTHVAGIFLARNNTIGVVGVAHGVAGSDVIAWGACDSAGRCPTTQVAAGIDAGKIGGAKVITMSLSFPAQDMGISTAVAAAWNEGIVLVASAGNHSTLRPEDNRVRWPANDANVIGVSGVQPDKTFASTSPCPHPLGGQVRSNSGSHVDLSAPFWALSTVGTNGYEDERHGWCGNSMATPHVSGAVALLRAQNPGWNNQQVVDRLFATAEDLGAFGRDTLFGNGLVDAADALVPPLTVVVSGPDKAPEFSSVQVTATVSNFTAPLTYAWTKDGSPTCGNTNTCTGTIGAGGSFTNFAVMVTDGDGDRASNSHNVFAEHPECQDCLKPRGPGIGSGKALVPQQREPRRRPGVTIRLRQR